MKPVARLRFLPTAGADFIDLGLLAAATDLPYGEYDLVPSAALPKVRVQFLKLPIGARFSYEPDGKDFIILERFGKGRIAEADPISALLQGIYSAAGGLESLMSLMVWTVPKEPQ